MSEQTETMLKNIREGMAMDGQSPHALTREDVVGICLDFYGDLPTVEQRNAIVQLRDSDNALRQANAQQAQELAYWKQQAAHFTKRCAEQGDSIAEDRRLLDQQAQEVERLKVDLQERRTICRKATQAIIDAIGSDVPENIDHAVDRLIAKLAAMTAERDNYLSKWRASADLNKGLLRDYDTSQARVKKAEDEARKWQRIRTPTHGNCCTCQKCGLDHDACRCDLDEMADEITQLQARVKELEERLIESEKAAYDVAGVIDHLKATLAEREGEVNQLNEALKAVLPIAVEWCSPEEAKEVAAIEQAQAALKGA